MTLEEATAWFDRMSRDEQIQILIEHYTLRQHLCARTLLVPTGTTNWVQRAIIKAEHLSECEHQLRKVIHAEEELIEEAKRRSFKRQCSNCTGTGLSESHNSDPATSCVICRGTGVLPYPA